MESNDKLQIELLAEKIPELKRLYVQHEKYHTKLSALERRKFRTPKEENELRELKSLKLRGVEKMKAIVAANESKATESNQSLAA